MLKKVNILQFKIARLIVYCLLLTAHCSLLTAQTGSWQTHADYTNAKGIEIVQNKVYCHSQNGFFYFDKADNQLVKLSKVNNLSESTLAQIRYSENLKTLLIAYESGNLDVVKINQNGDFDEIKNIDFIKKSTAIQGSKRINQIEFREDFAYLAADFGLVIFDSKKNEIKETYQNLGENGKELAIKQIVFARDSIFLNTSNGIIGTKFGSNTNLQFYGNWKQIIDSQLFKKPVFPKNDLIISPNEIETDAEGKIWIADGINGLLGNFEGNYKIYSPNSIIGDVFQVFYQNQQIYAVGINTQVFEENEWKTIQNSPIFTKKLTDQFGNIWESSGFGLTVRNPSNNQSKTFNTGKNNGNLPSSTINTIVEDREGLIWVGTDNGVAVIANSRDIFTRNTEAYQPIYEGRRLFLQENVNVIAVDGGNRKWFGTPRGVSLFNASADELILNFTEKNSPLPADYIYDIGINQKTGEVFFATQNGLISYKSDASEAAEDLSNIKIYPNPVRPDFEGVLTIENLTENATIKITDAAGKLIYETKSNGGTATWNLLDAKNSRINGGIYLIFMVSDNGSEKSVGKVLIIR